MSGYIYLKDWDRWQQGRPENAQWHKSWNAVLRHDRYLDLTLAQRGLLHDLWALVSMSGEGRVSVARGSLERQLGVRRVSLEPLIDAGFVRIGQRATSGRPSAREEEKREDKNEKDLARNLPRHAREEDQQEQPALVSAFAERCIQRWIQDDLARRLNPVERALVGHAIDLDDVQVRQNMAQVEAAGNPKAYLLTIAKKITANGAHP